MHDDEFPLSTFYLAWQKKLTDRLAERAHEAEPAARQSEDAEPPVVAERVSDRAVAAGAAEASAAAAKAQGSPSSTEASAPAA